MNRTRVNFWVDSLIFVLSLGMVSSGLLMHFVLPPGTGGRGGEGGLSVLGWGRHDWGALHWWLGVALIALVCVHLFMHWRWIWNVVAGKVKAMRRVRIAIAAIMMTLFVGAAALPFLLPVKGNVDRNSAEQQHQPRRHGGWR